MTISTFGDETLCLPQRHSSANGELIWEANPDKLPATGTVVTVRLRPAKQKDPKKDLMIVNDAEQ